LLAPCRTRVRPYNPNLATAPATTGLTPTDGSGAGPRRTRHVGFG